MDCRTIILALLVAGVSLLAPAVAPCQVTEPTASDEFAEAGPPRLPEDVASTPVITGAEVTWDAGRPASGETVKVRVRGEVLAYLLQNQQNWELVAGETRLAAELVAANLPAQAEKVDYSFATTETANGEGLLLDIDLTETPLPLNRLELRFAATSYFGLVKATTSADQQDYRLVGRRQVVYQEISGGQVYRLGTVKLDKNLERYLRLELPSPPIGKVQSIKGWFDPEQKLNAYKTEAALGPMREGGEPGESVWPIFMNPDSLPIARLKLVADAPGAVRRMHLATMEGSAPGSIVGQETIWASGLSQGDDQIANKWISPTGDASSGPFAVVVSDDGNPLQLNGVDVYLLEHWLVFEMPEGGILQLWQTDADEPRADEVLYSTEQVKQAGAVGTIDKWNSSRPPAVEPEQARSWAAEPFEFARNGDWRMRIYAYSALALILLGAGIALLRRELRNQHKSQ